MKHLKREYEHFKSLPIKLQELLLSFFLYSTAYPIISVFINAFIWKNNSSLIYLTALRLGQFIAVPFFFLLNGYLLKIFKIGTLYFIGSIFIAVSSVLVIFIKNTSLLSYILMGALLGLGAGLYWSNRNYLTIKETDDNNRSYFFGISFSFSVIIGLIVTFSVGWLIVFGLSYQVLIIIAFVLICLSGYEVLKNNHENPKIGSFFVTHPSFAWKRKRLIHLGIGLIEGLCFFLPSLLILKILGNEGVLGTLTAISSIISAILIYFYGRKSKKDDDRKYFIISIIWNIALSLLMAVFFNKLTVVIYVLLNGLIINFIWLTGSPIVMKNIDIDVVDKEETRFSYIVDSEFFLNFGRVSSIMLSIFLAYYFGDNIAMRYSALFLSLFQLIIFYYLEKTKLHS